MVGGVSISGACFGLQPILNTVQNAKNKASYTVKSKIESAKNGKIVKKFKKAIHDPDVGLIMGSALIGGGIAAYYAMPDLVKSLSCYFETRKDLVAMDDAKKLVTENVIAKSIGNSVLSKFVDRLSTLKYSPYVYIKDSKYISDQIKKYGLCICTLLSLNAAFRRREKEKEKQKEIEDLFEQLAEIMCEF